MTGWLEWLERTAVGTAVRDSVWLYPAVEIVHILGLALLVGSAAAWDVRLLGVSRRLAVSELGGHLLPAARLGFALALLSGLLLFTADAVSLAANPAFRVKLVLIAAAVTNAGIFHARTSPTAAWDRGVPPPRAARLAGAFSLLLWGLAVVAGRLIAYV